MGPHQQLLNSFRPQSPPAARAWHSHRLSVTRTTAPAAPGPSCRRRGPGHGHGRTLETFEHRGHHDEAHSVVWVAVTGPVRHSRVPPPGHPCGRARRAGPASGRGGQAAARAEALLSHSGCRTRTWTRRARPGRPRLPARGPGGPAAAAQAGPA